MALELAKDSIDLGIVTTNVDRMLEFYRDTLGLTVEGEMPMPGGGYMTRLLCGTSTIKIVVNKKDPEAKAPPGGIGGSTGYRYWTISVTNLESVTNDCKVAGYNIVVPPTEIREGVSISMVEDPDGNWVELLQAY